MQRYASFAKWNRSGCEGLDQQKLGRDIAESTLFDKIAAMEMRTDLGARQASMARKGQLQRLQSTDMLIAEEVLKNASVLMAPEDQTQRKAFEKLMPWMYVLRNKGFSWAQLTNLLTECGFKLQPSTVRTYYSEMLASRLDVCQARMNEQLALLESLRQETRGAEIPTIAGRVNNLLAKQRSMAEEKMEAIFGAGAMQTSRRVPSDGYEGAAGGWEESTTLPRSGGGRGKPTERRGSGPAASMERGRPGTANGPGAHGTRSPSLPGVDETPPVPRSPARQPSQAQNPVEPPQASAVEDTSARRYSVKKLQAGVPPLQKRTGVPEEVYKPGAMEHPAIPGLILELQERLYGAALEYADNETGELHTETAEQKRFRVTWRQWVPRVATRTDSTFTKMDKSLFRNFSGQKTT